MARRADTAETPDAVDGIAADEATVLQRVIFPESGDPQALPLFLDPEVWSWSGREETSEERLARMRGVVAVQQPKRAARLTDRNGLGWLRGRRGLRIPSYKSTSLGTYFNAFPASYWKSWTSLESVELRVQTTGTGRIVVYRSNARAVVQRVDGVAVEGQTVSTFTIPLTSFLDGGWLWFDLIAGDGALELVQADWIAPDGTPKRADDNATVSITTLNRGDYCTRLLATIGNDKEALAVLDRVQVIDQGSERIADNPGYQTAVDALDGKLKLIEQANIGGSGGFSRGMLETVEAGTSGYIILLDDDVEIEPESIRRAVTFANYCHTPTIVGGHMFDMYDKAQLHAFAEGIKWSSFMWGPFTPERHDFGTANLRQTQWMHRRYDVDYNGWWMCLIPVQVIKEIGASLPVFIKWDDAEYSLRAREHGYNTVSLPGAAVWHVSWVDKDDTHDWQAFFHERNRLIAALLHSPEKRGGRLWRSMLASDVKNLLTMDYYTIAMRMAAIRNVFEGPDQLHTDMVDRLPRVRAMGAGFTEATLVKASAEIPHFPARENKELTDRVIDPGPHGVGFAFWLLGQVSRHSRKVTSDVSVPKGHLAYQDARWFEVPNWDSVLVSNAEGSGATWHIRDPKKFRSLLMESIRLNRRYRREWDRLRAQYRAALPEITSLRRWKQTIESTQR
ncbi:glycosyltransferase [Humibacter ginsenosidimutans]|uniref:Glycosyltransferase family 2 protein n=1 Tax=Humibacter ginsenosidimutans TaxID=2599293 RepID=A0A5B8M6V0_9MICO|nr:glycosyltransferase [Humibacter ginsenosidimutans]QDZ16438.1 glycosyltransferase family 2 protein [Humibacter ginsenosidimutans]